MSATDKVENPAWRTFKKRGDVARLEARVAELEAERDARPSVEFMEAAKALRDLVDSAEAVTWRSERGRLRDAKQWTVFYCAVAKWEREKGGTA